MVERGASVVACFADEHEADDWADAQRRAGHVGVQVIPCDIGPDAKEAVDEKEEEVASAQALQEEAEKEAKERAAECETLREQLKESEAERARLVARIAAAQATLRGEAT